MAEDFLAALMNNPTRARLLRVFVLNQDAPFTLAQAARRAGVPAASAGKEISALEKLGLVKKRKMTITLRNTPKRVAGGAQKESMWAFDTQCRHAEALSKFIHQISPMRHSVIVETLRRSGRLAAVVLSGTFVGDSSRPADLVVAADNLNEGRLEAAVRSLEPLYGREIRYAVFTTTEFRYRLTIQDRLLRDTLDYPHLVLLDRTKLL